MHHRQAASRLGGAATLRAWTPTSQWRERDQREYADGFYAFLAEARGARLVVAVDNEQYRVWVRSRWGVELEGGEGFTAIRELLHSTVEYRRLNAFDLDQLEETFDFILCFGILHRVVNPMGLLKVLRRRLSADGRVLLETYGSPDRTPDASAAIHAYEAGEVYACLTSCTGASPPQVWTRWPAMRTSRASS